MADKITNTRQEKYAIGSLEEMSQRWHIVGGGGAKEPKDESDKTPPSFEVQTPETQSALTSRRGEATSTNGVSAGGSLSLDSPPSSRYRSGY